MCYNILAEIKGQCKVSFTFHLGGGESLSFSYGTHQPGRSMRFQGASCIPFHLLDEVMGFQELSLCALFLCPASMWALRIPA